MGIEFGIGEMKLIWVKTIVVILVVLVAVLAIILRNESAGRQIGNPIRHGNIEVPVERWISYNTTSDLCEEIIQYWSKGENENWTDGEKVGVKNARVVLGCLAAGKCVEEMNKYLLEEKSTGTAGSRWLLNSGGGYNFNTMACTPILYLFHNKPELLYPETKEYLAKNILTIQGSGSTRRVPYLPIQDSENHILMAESSRYLKNQ